MAHSKMAIACKLLDYMNTYIKILVAPLLFLCLFDMPYGYYNLVRFVTTAACAYFAYEYHKIKKEKLVFMFIFLALLFQPFEKLALGRAVWNLVDVVVGIGLLYLAYVEHKKKNS
jgi:hypothetical protein